MALAKKQVKKLAVTKPYQIGGHYYELFKDAIGEVVSPDPIVISKVTEWVSDRIPRCFCNQLKAMTLLCEVEMELTFEGCGDFSMSLMFQDDYFELVRTVNHAQTSLSKLLAKKPVSKKEAKEGGYYYEQFKNGISEVISPDPKVISKVTEWLLSADADYYWGKFDALYASSNKIFFDFDRGDNYCLTLKYQDENLNLIRTENSAVITLSMLMTGKEED